MAAATSVDHAEYFTRAIQRHARQEQIPERWQLRTLFSQAAHDTFGDVLLSWWAAVLKLLCTYEKAWEAALLGLAPESSEVEPGFQVFADVRSLIPESEVRHGETDGR